MMPPPIEIQRVKPNPIIGRITAVIKDKITNMIEIGMSIRQLIYISWSIRIRAKIFVIYSMMITTINTFNTNQKVYQN